MREQRRSSGSVPQNATVRRRWAAALLVLLGVAAVSLTACAAVPYGPAGPDRGTGAPGASAPDPLDRTSASTGDDRLSIAVQAVDGGRIVPWLRTSPLRLWSEWMNGRRTLIIDAPINTYDVPTTAAAGLLWTGKDTSETAAGCARRCDADGFVGTITSEPARASTSGGIMTITAGRDVIEFAPTAAPIPERSSCDLDAIDPIPCSRYVSVLGSDSTGVLDRFRTAPLTATIAGAGRSRTITVHAGHVTVTAPIRTDGAGFTTPAGSARSVGACASGCDRVAFVTAFFADAVAYRVHGSSLLLLSGDRTLQLEAR